MNISKKLIKNSLLVIIAFTFLVRLSVALNYPVWTDEATLITDSYRSYRQLFFLEYWDTAHPPLYNILNKLLITLVGTNIPLLRLPSLIFASLSFIYLYKITKKIDSKNYTAFFSLIFAAFSGFLTMLSIFIRPYGLNQFFVLGLIYHFLTSLKSKSISQYFLVFTFSLLATFTDYSSLWVIACLFASLIIYRLYQYKILHQSFGLKKAAIYFFLLFSPFILWLPIFINRLDSAVSLESYVVDYLKLGPFTLVGRIINDMIFFSTQSHDYRFVATLTLITAAYLFVLASKSLHSKNFKKTFLFIFISLLITLPILTSLIISYKVFPIILARNLFPVYYAFIIGAALITGHLYRSNRVSGIFLALIICSFQYFSFQPTIDINTNNEFRQVIPVVNYFKNTLTENENIPVLIDTSLASSFPLYKYYFGTVGIDKVFYFDPSQDLSGQYYFLSKEPQIPPTCTPSNHPFNWLRVSFCRR